MLNELDKELERRGHKFVRYADDCMILCKSRKSAERTLEHIIPFITGKLYLKINLEKTTVSHISKVKYLGYGILPIQREMPNACTSQVNQEDEEPSQGIDSEGKQVEQPGERREAQEIYKWVDKLLPVCGYEKPDGNYG